MITFELCHKLIDLGVISQREYHEYFGITAQESEDENTIMTPTGLVRLRDLDKFFERKNDGEVAASCTTFE